MAVCLPLDLLRRGACRSAPSGSRALPQALDCLPVHLSPLSSVVLPARHSRLLAGLHWMLSPSECPWERLLPANHAARRARQAPAAQLARPLAMTTRLLLLLLRGQRHCRYQSPRGRVRTADPVSPTKQQLQVTPHRTQQAQKRTPPRQQLMQPSQATEAKRPVALETAHLLLLPWLLLPLPHRRRQPGLTPQMVLMELKRKPLLRGGSTGRPLPRVRTTTAPTYARCGQTKTPRCWTPLRCLSRRV